MEHAELTERIIGRAMRVHNALGPGFLEAVYQNALAMELEEAGCRVQCQARLNVQYRGRIVGEYVADMIVDGCVIIENKAVRTLAPIHGVQLVHYLFATGIEVGLLLNFGALSLEFRRRSRSFLFES